MAKSKTIELSDISLSFLVECSMERPRGVILALHGGGLCSKYWANPDDGQSLFEVARALDFHVIAVDRPGYGASADAAPVLTRLASQVDIFYDLLESLKPSGVPIFVLGHSLGGIIALLMAADDRSERLAGVATCGVPVRFRELEGKADVTSWSESGSHFPLLSVELRDKLLLGPPATYTASAAAHDFESLRRMSSVEHRESTQVPNEWPRLLPRIKVPVHFTLAEFESMTETGEDVLEDFIAQFRNSRYVRKLLQQGAGHNISSHRVARAYHMKVIVFFEECLQL